MVVLDANFSSETIDCILQVCHSSQIPVFFEPTDPRKARKATQSAFASVIHFASPNIHELRTMASEVLPDRLPTGMSMKIRTILKNDFSRIIKLFGKCNLNNTQCLAAAFGPFYY